ncbi:MAG: hypothetical protein JWM99_2449 [Verrucomicrobiales bacterium]|nr:hypothetical protein [Verrucomicrobiales bacterium]
MFTRGSFGLLTLILSFWACPVHAERINQEGRILPETPTLTNSVLFNTPEADAVLSTMQIFPRAHPWNEDISQRPLLVNSDAMIAQIIGDLATNRRTFRVFFEMNFALVPDNQPLVPVSFFNYPDESDPSPYPVPVNMPIETWPLETGVLTLPQWQRDDTKIGGDRHAIIVQPGTGLIWETWLTKLSSTGQWTASNGAKFDLKSNATRPAGWTSGDAAGLAMFPALIRFDECERGMVEHAVRLVVKRSRREYIYPATHFASNTSASQTNVPAMGQRLRLRSGFSIPESWKNEEKAVLKALKKYGAIVADNGNFFSVSATPDNRWPSGVFDHLSTLSITNFEVIQTTGPNQGPRSPGAPVATAGLDQIVPLGMPVTLLGNVAFTGPRPAIRWNFYSGPGNITFDDATAEKSIAHFPAAGIYTLELSADDGIHGIVYDAVKITIDANLRAEIALSGQSVDLAWFGSQPSFVVEHSTNIVSGTWLPMLTTTVHTATFLVTNSNEFFRLKAP